MDNWSNEIDEKEIEIINNIIDQNILDNDPISEVPTINIDNILTKDPAFLSSDKVIQYECDIAYFVQVLMEGSLCNGNKFFRNKSQDGTLSLKKYRVL